MGNHLKSKTHPVKNAGLVLLPDETIRQKAYAIEREIFFTTGLEIGNEIVSIDIPIIYHGNNYMHTIICKRDAIKPNLLLIHGYLGTGVIFHKLFRHFIDYFNIYLYQLIITKVIK